MPFTRRDFLRNTGAAVAGACFFPLFRQERPLWALGLPRSIPEAQGVSSRDLLAFLEAVEQSPHEFHGLMVLRHGHVIAEGWWAPYRPDLNHSLYSMSKSFTATAIGFAAAAGHFSLDDKVVSFFPDDLPGEVSENLAAMTLRHLLTMSVGHATDTTWDMVQSENWVRKFLSYPVEKSPGTEFLYHSGATYMLSAILQKATGKNLLEWLTPRLFKPLGIEGATWETCPLDIPTGGWGLRLKTEDLAKFGQLYLQGGKWDGFQILPAGWVEEATGFKIENGLPEARDTSDWAQGYCYQFWRSRHNSYRGDGAFGQYTLVLPEQDAVIAIHSESPDMQGQLNLVWSHLLPAMKNGPLPPDLPAEKALRRKLGSLAIAPPQRLPDSPLARQFSGKTLDAEPNENGVQSLRFDFGEKTCVFTLKSHLGEFAIEAGINEWRRGETRMPGTPPDLFPIPYEKLTTSKVAATAGWEDEHKFLMYVQFYETAHHDIITCRFDGDGVAVNFLNSVSKMLPDWIPEKRAALRCK